MEHGRHLSFKADRSIKAGRCRETRQPPGASSDRRGSCARYSSRNADLSVSIRPRLCDPSPILFCRRTLHRFEHSTGCRFFCRLERDIVSIREGWPRRPVGAATLPDVNRACAGWTRDGSAVYIRSNRDGNWGIYKQPLSCGAPETDSHPGRQCLLVDAGKPRWQMADLQNP